MLTGPWLPAPLYRSSSQAIPYDIGAEISAAWELGLPGVDASALEQLEGGPSVPERPGWCSGNGGALLPVAVSMVGPDPVTHRGWPGMVPTADSDTPLAAARPSLQ